MLDPHREGIWWLCYAVGGILLAGVGPLVPLGVRVTANQYKVDHLNPMMKHFYPDRSGLFQDDNAPTTGHQGLLNGLMNMKMR